MIVRAVRVPGMLLALLFGVAVVNRAPEYSVLDVAWWCVCAAILAASLIAWAGRAP